MGSGEWGVGTGDWRLATEISLGVGSGMSLETASHLVIVLEHLTPGPTPRSQP